MKNNLDLWKSTCSVPAEAQTKITGGRMSGKTNIRPQWRIMVLTKVFGPCGLGWYYTTTAREQIEAGVETSVHVTINLFIRDGEGWSMPIEGQGGSMLLAKEKAGPYHCDEAYKMATTDALSVACKQLGIGADVYMNQDSSNYINSDDPEDSKMLAEYEVAINGCGDFDSLKNTFASAWKDITDPKGRKYITNVYNEMKRTLTNE